MIRLRPATSADIVEYYGEPQQISMRAIVADRDGEILGVAGYSVVKTTAVMFSDISQEMKEHPMSVYRASLRVLKMAKASGLHVAAVIDKTQPTSRKLLERLGLRPTGTMAGDEEIFSWPQHH